MAITAPTAGAGTGGANGYASDGHAVTSAQNNVLLQCLQACTQRRVRAEPERYQLDRLRLRIADPPFCANGQSASVLRGVRLNLDGASLNVSRGERSTSHGFGNPERQRRMHCTARRHGDRIPVAQYGATGPIRADPPSGGNARTTPIGIATSQRRVLRRPASAVPDDGMGLRFYLRPHRRRRRCS